MKEVREERFTKREDVGFNPAPIPETPLAAAQDGGQGERANERTNAVRVPVLESAPTYVVTIPAARRKTRQSFDIFEDQYDALKSCSLPRLIRRAVPTAGRWGTWCRRRSTPSSRRKQKKSEPFASTASMNKQRLQFEGFYVPNSTQVPDTLFDELMADLSGAELKVVLYIIRRTFGFKKAQDNISLRQMVEGITARDGRVLDRGTGLGKASVVRAVAALEARGVIARNKRHSAERGDEATTYALKLRAVSQNGTPPPQAKVERPVSQNKTPLGLMVGHPRVPERDPQGTGLQCTENTVNGEKQAGTAYAWEAPAADRTDLRRLPDLDQEREATQAVADVILGALGDRHSQAFYYLVAAKVPEPVVRRTLSEIRRGALAGTGLRLSDEGVRRRRHR